MVTRKKIPPGTRDKNISNHLPGEKEKYHRTKRKKRPTPSHHLKKSRDMQSVRQKKTKTLCKHCNATITRVLNTSGANNKINLNCESEISY